MMKMIFDNWEKISMLDDIQILKIVLNSMVCEESEETIYRDRHDPRFCSVCHCGVDDLTRLTLAMTAKPQMATFNIHGN